MDSEARFRAVDELMGRKLDAFAEQTNAADYLFASRSPSEHTPEWDRIDGWREIRLPYFWEPSQFEALFSREIVVPESIEGVEVDGSSLELEITFPLGGTVYIDSRPAVTEEWWTDSRIAPIVLSERVRAGERFHVGICVRKGGGFGLFVRSRLRYSKVDLPIIWPSDRSTAGRSGKSCWMRRLGFYPSALSSTMTGRHFRIVRIAH